VDCSRVIVAFPLETVGYVEGSKHDCELGFVVPWEENHALFTQAWITATSRSLPSGSLNSWLLVKPLTFFPLIETDPSSW
jgi:hypothetical protein